MFLCSVMALSKMLARRVSPPLAALSLPKTLTECRLSVLPFCFSSLFRRTLFPPFGERHFGYSPLSSTQRLLSAEAKREVSCQAQAPVYESRAESSARRDPYKHPLDKDDISTQTGRLSQSGSDVIDIPSGEHHFFSESAKSWESLGVQPAVAEALRGAGFERPSRVQEAAVPKALEGRDVVLAAETGSGKTHSYLIPLMDLLLKSRNLQQPPPSDAYTPSAVTSALAEGQEVRLPFWAENESKRASAFVLVLCPNATLCQQVADMAHSLKDGGGSPLLKIAVVAGGQQPPPFTPDIVVATPGGLLNMLYAFDRKKRRRTAFARDVRYVVVDEADMLLGGGFARDVAQLLLIFRQAEKELSKMLESAPTDERDTIATEGRTGSGEEESEGDESTEGVRSWVEERGEPESSAGGGGWEADEKEDRRQAQEGGIWDEDVVASGSSSGHSFQASSPSRRRERRRRVWVRSKQFIFVAATLPDAGKMSVGAMLRKQFPEAAYVRGGLLHQHNPSLEMAWVEIGRENRVSALMEAVAGPTWQEGRLRPLVQRTLVFTNSTEAAEAVSKLLTSQGLAPLKYHSGVSALDKAAAIRTFSDRGGVLVCTDAAARGLDVPDVGHVIQAEFATCAVDFLHRIGRSARAGRAGRVTSMFTEDRWDLVEAVREAVDAQEPVAVGTGMLTSTRIIEPTGVDPVFPPMCHGPKRLIKGGDVTNLPLSDSLQGQVPRRISLMFALWQHSSLHCCPSSACQPSTSKAIVGPRSCAQEGAFSRKRSFRKKLKKYGVTRQGVPNQPSERGLRAEDERQKMHQEV